MKKKERVGGGKWEGTRELVGGGGGGGRGGDGPGTCMGKSLGSRNKTEKALDEEQKHLDLEPNG